jgi:Ca2+-transporting ATPase
MNVSTSTILQRIKKLEPLLDESCEHLAEFLNLDLNQGRESNEIDRIRAEYGENRLSQRKGATLLKSFIAQVKNPFGIILFCAGVATVLMGKTVDSMIIFSALLVNVAVGVFQEGRAGKAFERLQESREQFSHVIRSGKQVRIPSSDVIVGDVVVLESGHYVPADMRICEAYELFMNEAVVTGESEEVEKRSEPRDEERVFRSHRAYAGTVITSGYGKGIVTSVGIFTEFGRISESLSKKNDTLTPIQITLREMSMLLFWITLGIVFLIFILGIVRGENLWDMVLISIAVGVSAVPEGLPAAVTVVLALGMERILKKGGLVRNLLAAETLGSTTVILTDKTGTLTQGEMRLEHSIPTSAILYPAVHQRERHVEDEMYLLELATRASDAFYDEVTGSVHGRPVERAIVSAWNNYDRSGFTEHIGKRIAFKSFSSRERAAYSLHDVIEKNEGEKKSDVGTHSKKYILISTGAPELLLQRSKYLLRDGISELLPQDWRLKLERFQHDESAKGKRLTGISFALITESHILSETFSTLSWTFGGFLMFSDSLREDVRMSIQQAQDAGARVIMVTGDNAGTARSIAHEAGIVASMSAEVCTGSELEGMSDREIIKLLPYVSVFARMTPQEKMRILKILQDEGEIVAMTGDGVNDAPALHLAHIGIAVGSGTEVAKESADLILMDSSFSVIVNAIEEGRRIIQNMRKIVVHLLSTSLSQIVLIAGALILHLPLPLLPTQILWINIAQGGLLNFAFAFEPGDSRNMKDRRMYTQQGILTHSVKKLIASIALLNGVFVFILFLLMNHMNYDISVIRTTLFLVVSLSTIVYTFACKDFHTFITNIPLNNNIFLLVAVCVSCGVLSLPFLIPSIGGILGIVPFSLDMIFPLGISLLGSMIIVELSKFIIMQQE